VSTHDVLSVWLGDVRAGTLTRSGEGATFMLDDDYRGLAQRPVLGQAFEDNPTARHFVRQGVPSWFGNLLPEGPLRELIAERAGVNPARSWFLLDLLGLDLPGAVVVCREQGTSALELKDAEESGDAEEQPLKFSLAGVQLKFSALRDERGLTVPAQGRGGDWIVKLPDQRFEGVPETEYDVMRWAREAGLHVPDVLLLDLTNVDGLPPQLYERPGKAFAIQRFDRVAGERVHMEDFAQVLGLSAREKYGHANFESIGRVLAAIAPADVDEMIRRLVFQVLSGNGDAHVKNWSLIYPDGIHPRLSPAYDLLNTTAFVYDDDLGLRLGGTKEFRQITLTTFRRFGARVGVDEGSVEAVVRDQIDSTVRAWELMRAEWTAPAHIRHEIDRRLTTLPLVANEFK
jgi:serine/threonine-protein kinase HipA